MAYETWRLHYAAIDDPTLIQPVDSTFRTLPYGMVPYQMMLVRKEKMMLVRKEKMRMMSVITFAHLEISKKALFLFEEHRNKNSKSFLHFDDS